MEGEAEYLRRRFEGCFERRPQMNSKGQSIGKARRVPQAFTSDADEFAVPNEALTDSPDDRSIELPFLYLISILFLFFLKNIFFIYLKYIKILFSN